MKVNYFHFKFRSCLKTPLMNVCFPLSLIVHAKRIISTGKQTDFWLPTQLGFLQVIGQMSIPEGLLGLQKKSACCWQFSPSIQLDCATRIKINELKLIYKWKIFIKVFYCLDIRVDKKNCFQNDEKRNKSAITITISYIHTES